MKLSRRSLITHLTVAATAFGLGLGADRAPLALAADPAVAVVGRAAAFDGWAAAPSAPAVGTLVVQNAYYPTPGYEDRVLETRLRASAVRAELGLVVGRVLRRLEGQDDAPTVIWEASYPDAEARERDVAALDGTAFDEVSAHMGTLLDRFARTVWEVVEQP